MKTYLQFLPDYKNLNWKVILQEICGKDFSTNYDYLLPKDEKLAVYMSHVRYVFGASLPLEFYTYVEKKMTEQYVEGFEEIQSALPKKFLDIIDNVKLLSDQILKEKNLPLEDYKFPDMKEYRYLLREFYSAYYVKVEV